MSDELSHRSTDMEDAGGQATLPAGEARGQELERGTFVGRYLIVEKLGAGGMGVVYGAYDPQLNRKIAIKLLHAPPAGDAERAKRLTARIYREAQSLARLSHANVLGIFDVGMFENQVFIVIENLEGRHLGAWLAEKPRRWREIVDVFMQAGRGLAAAHASGLVHRDFKPPNVLVAADGQVKVLDFGHASRRVRGHDPARGTVAGHARPAHGPRGRACPHIQVGTGHPGSCLPVTPVS